MWSSPAIGSDGTIYVGSRDDNLYAFYQVGTLKWTFQTGDYVFSSPAIGSDGTIYVGSGDSKLYAIHPDGTLKWTLQTGGLVRSSPAIGSDGTIYVGSDDGNLYAIEESSGGLAKSPWPMFHHDLKHTGRVRRKWKNAYNTLFDNSDNLALFRQYRDAFLTKTAKGKLYTTLLYNSSEEALEVLLNNPELMLEAKELIEADKDAVSEVLNGNEGAIYNTDEIISFMAAYAQKSPPALKGLTRMVIREMLKKRKQGKLFLGFRLQ